MSDGNNRIQALGLATALAGGLWLTSWAAEVGTGGPAASRSPTGGFVSISSAADLLTFDNGDLLYGALVSIDQRSVRWQRPDAARALEFQADGVTEILFRQGSVAKRVVAPSCRVRLTNDDELEGRLVAMDADTVVLETWYSGPLTIPRSAIQVVLPVPAKGKTLFAGPAGLEGWTMGKVKTVGEKGGEWRYKDGALYAVEAASIARDVQLPDVASLQFDVAWKGMLYLAIALYTDYLQPVSLANREAEPPFGGFYSLQINSYSVNLLPVTQKDPLRPLGQAMVSSFSRGNRSHVEIRADKLKHLIALLVDGLVVRQWIDSEGFVGKGTGIRLVHQGQGSVRLSNLQVSEWDGQFEEPPTLSPGGGLDQVKLRNGDKVEGNLQAIRDGKLAVVTAGVTRDVPLSQVKQIEFAAAKSGQSIRAMGNVRAFFGNGGSVSLNLERWDKQGVVGSNPALGSVRFDPAAFTRLVFLSHLKAGN
jgi:hypothetical protein